MIQFKNACCVQFDQVWQNMNKELLYDLTLFYFKFTLERFHNHGQMRLKACLRITRLALTPFHSVDQILGEMASGRTSLFDWHVMTCTGTLIRRLGRRVCYRIHHLFKRPTSLVLTAHLKRLGFEQMNFSSQRSTVTYAFLQHTFGHGVEIALFCCSSLETEGGLHRVALLVCA